MHLMRHEDSYASHSNDPGGEKGGRVGMRCTAMRTMRAWRFSD
jgi:lysozyme family protein